MKKRKVLLIGWDGADWKYLMPLIDKGLMPSLSRLIDNGCMGRLATINPPLSPMLWTSIITGKRPYKHGIHGFTEPNSDQNGIRPILSTSRTCKTLWNILTQNKKKTHAVGWWPSHPAEPINGIMVSNLYKSFELKGDDSPLLKGTVHPSSKTELFAKLRVLPQELTGNHLHPFVKNLEEIDQKNDPRLKNIATNLAECSTIHSAATYIMENEEWEFMAVYYDALDHFCHGFMKYNPPYRKHILKSDYELYNQVVSSACRFHDMMLGSMLDMVDDETTVMLVSDHGFYPHNNRPTKIPREPAGPAVEHSPYGIIAMSGPDIRKDTLITGASILDVTPTLLSLYGLPIAEDMDGKVLLDVFNVQPEIKTIRSWENLTPPVRPDGTNGDGSHASNTEFNDSNVGEELNWLIELGYISDNSLQEKETVNAAIKENKFNLALAYIDGNEWHSGIEILEKLHADDPQILRFALRLIHAYLNVGKLKKARALVQNVREIFDRENPQIDLLEGTLLLAEERYRKALKLFKKVESEAGNRPMLYLRIANAYLRLNKLDDAERAILKELQNDEENATSYYTLGLILHRKMNFEEALEAFLDAVGLLYFYPAAHFYIGECLLALGHYEKAIQAYENCLKLVPTMNRARQRIISIYETMLHQPGKAIKYKLNFENNIDGTVTIVSGLPRSGTSLMMQMLKAGGMEVLSDNTRLADESNPNGYFEHEGIKNLWKNNDLISLADGKAVKVIAQLLKHLPLNYNYQIIFMERDMFEVVRSQQKMLVRDGKNVDMEQFPTHLLEEYKKSLAETKNWAAEHANVEIIYIKYADIIENPFHQAMLVNDFLSGNLEIEKMARLVDGKLYRERSV
ncbi:MAG: alkaline phosphatase family protein [Bacteroidota bacterium]